MYYNNAKLSTNENPKWAHTINYDLVGSLPITFSFHEIQWRWSYFLRGDAYGIVLQGFCALVVQCARLNLTLQVQE